MIKSTYALYLLVVVFIIATACSSSRKFDYDSAYKFKVIKQSEKQEPALEPESIPSTESLTASSKEIAEIDSKLAEKVATAEQKIFDKLEITAEEAREYKPSDWKERIEDLDKQEAKALKQELKRDLKDVKQLVKEQRKSGELTRIEATQAATGYTRLGLIIGGVGLLLLILGLVTTGSGATVLIVFGAIGLAVGLVLILMDVL